MVLKNGLAALICIMFAASGSAAIPTSTAWTKFRFTCRNRAVASGSGPTPASAGATADEPRRARPSRIREPGCARRQIRGQPHLAGGARESVRCPAPICGSILAVEGGRHLQLEVTTAFVAGGQRVARMRAR